jgi:hypothetical protein
MLKCFAKKDISYSVFEILGIDSVQIVLHNECVCGSRTPSAMLISASRGVLHLSLHYITYIADGLSHILDILVLVCYILLLNKQR